MVAIDCPSVSMQDSSPCYSIYRTCFSYNEDVLREKQVFSSIFIEMLWLLLRASYSQYLSDVKVPQLPVLYCKAASENAVGFQLLLSSKDYIL